MKRWIVALAALGTGCECLDETVIIDLGVDVELHAVAQLGGDGVWIGHRNYRLLAVGDSGTVVFVGTDSSGKRMEMFAESMAIGDADLHEIWIAESGSGLWVVGDAGTVATSDNLGQTWNYVTLPGGNADLHGISEFNGRLVIVGDELVLARNIDGTWIEAPTPIGGWGQLRAVGSNREQVFAVGLDGVGWSASDPGGEWVAEDMGVDVDLFDVGSLYSSQIMVAVGAEGTLLILDWKGWQPADSGVTVDLIDYHNEHVLDAEGNIYPVDYDYGPLNVSRTHPGSTALDNTHPWDPSTVGNGVAYMRPWDDC
jgi:hypothetical protein